MDSQRDFWQAAADAVGGYEGGALRHNCKLGIVTLDGVAVEDGNLKVCFLMSEATHGKIHFGGRVTRDIHRYADGEPETEIPDDWTPYTACLCISISDQGPSQLMTYAGTSWGARKAFGRQLLLPYVRLKRRAFPVATLGFLAGKQDSYGNSSPTFDVLGWQPCGDFAALLGESPEFASIAPPVAPALEAPHHDSAGDQEAWADDSDIPF